MTAKSQGKRAGQLAAEALGVVYEYDPNDPVCITEIAKLAGIIRQYGREVRAQDVAIVQAKHDEMAKRSYPPPAALRVLADALDRTQLP